MNQLLPQRIDNAYRGYSLALWLFGLVVAVKILQSVMVIFNGSSIARSADGIPLDTYPSGAAQTVVALFALSGFARLIVSLLCVLVLVRYRSAVPFMLGLLALDYLFKELILHFLPIASIGAPPGPVMNFVLFILAVAGLVLSLRARRIARDG